MICVFSCFTNGVGYCAFVLTLRLPDMSFAVQENVFRFAVSVNNALLMQVAQPKNYFARIKSTSIFGEAWLTTHVIYMEFQIPAFHYG